MYEQDCTTSFQASWEREICVTQAPPVCPAQVTPQGTESH